MWRRLFIVGLVTGGLFAASGAKPADAYVSVDVRLHFGSDHSFWFEREPVFVPVPHSYVHYAAHDECDIYRYGDWYYVNNGAQWYRARGFRGPFVPITYVAVPRPIVVVPAHYRRFANRYWTHDPWASRWKGRAVRYERDVRYDDRYSRNDRYDRNDRGRRDRDRDERRWRSGDRDRDDDRRWSNRDDDRKGGKGKNNGKGKSNGKGKKNGHGNSGRGNGHGRG
jgi:hypothetical protein